jgi:hypothetical protein
MNSATDHILEDILEVRAILHGAGTVSAEALAAMARHAGDRRVRRSAETGSGATTLLLSHLSADHTVFALDIGGSVENVRRSPLLRKEVVSFIEGPSQHTLPRYQFADKLQLALIDGPHAYPFPEIEYYCLYPHLESGALLILDDIHIRSINNLFEFLRSDEMFRLDEVVRTTAFFTRTEAPTFDPLGDGWRQQKYNERTLFRYDWRSRLRSVLPRSVLRGLAAYRLPVEEAQKGCSVEILSPRQSECVTETGLVRGRARLCPGAHLWVLVHRKNVDGWWPQNNGSVAVVNDCWSAQVNYGGHHDAGCQFEVAAVLVAPAVHRSWLEWVHAVKATGAFPPVRLPMRPHILKETYRTVQRGPQVE